jgi:L-asparaginase/Glu-tRNA(Gln) amidotransferase subunit D
MKPMSFDGLIFEASYGAKAALYEPRSGLALFQHRPFTTLPSLPYKDLSSEKLLAASKSVLRLTAYPGLSFDRLNTDGLQAVIVEAYHCGTANSENAAGSIVEFVKKNKDVSLFMSCLPSRNLVKPYESTVKIAEAGGLAIADLQPHVIYTFVVLGLGGGIPMPDIKRALGNWMLAFAQR